MRFENAITRRACLQLILAAGVAPRLKASPVAHQRYYQAGAAITFCGMTIFSKKDVGGGYAVVEEAPRKGQTAVALQFAGGSWPAKAHGVNRLGYIRELVVEGAGGDPVKAEYFGFMTSSAEKSFDQARKQFVEQNDKPVPYSATGGSAGEGKWNFSLSHLTMPSHWTFSHCGELDAEVRNAVAADKDAVRSEARFGPSTFLNSLRQSLKNPADSTDHSLVYNGKPYRMHCTKQPDGPLMRLNGTLEESATGQRTPFKLWYERDSENYLPVRIEYKAKSFLKLVFETEPHWRGPSASLILTKENA